MPDGQMKGLAGPVVPAGTRPVGECATVLSLALPRVLSYPENLHLCFGVSISRNVRATVCPEVTQFYTLYRTKYSKAQGCEMLR